MSLKLTSRLCVLAACTVLGTACSLPDSGSDAGAVDMRAPASSDASSSPVTARPGTSGETRISIWAAGAPLADAWPRMRVLVNGTAVAEVDVNSTAPDEYRFSLPTPRPGSSLDVVFVNGSERSERTPRVPRQLLVQHIDVDGTPLPLQAGRYDQGLGVAALDDSEVVSISGPVALLKRSGALRFRLSSGLAAPQLGLVINDDDPYSITMGAYYAARRGVPASNVVHVHLPVRSEITPLEFAPAKAQIDAALPPWVQAIELAWEKPWIVGDNSITSAVTFGYQSSAFVRNPSYYDTTNSTLPFSQLGIRPAMLLAASDVATAQALVERGVAADATMPTGTAYLMATSDGTRSLRTTNYRPELLGHAISPFVDVAIVHAEFIQAQDILFYFQGLAQLSHLAEANVYRPGAIADHLTSYGGRLDDPFGQTSILEFVSAGATGTFGTVVEPYAIAEKFPDPRIAVAHYTKGKTLIETYWRSVAYPVQGLFVGEALANPWQRLLPVGDTRPPTVPGNAFASASQRDVFFYWVPSVDDIGVAGYRVYRDGTLRGTVLPIAPNATPSNFFNDSDQPPGATFTYSVSAFDGAGNESERSPGSAVTIAIPTDDAGPTRSDGGTTDPIPGPIDAIADLVR